MNQGGFHLRRAEAAIAADLEPRRLVVAKPAPHQGTERLAEVFRILQRQGFADGAANVVFPQNRRVEAIGSIIHGRWGSL